MISFEWKFAEGAVKESKTQEIAADTFCEVNTKALIRDIPRTLYGTNIEWFNNGNGIFDDKGISRSALTDAARDEGISLVRFPGGTFSDYYHWKDGTGPVEDRPTAKHFTDPGASKNIMGSPELVRFTKAIGGEPLITVNAGTGTSQEAAQWVAYFNVAANAQRQSDGFVAPINVHYWEVGNELYLPGNPGDIKVAVSPDVYTARFKEFARAMRAADPTIALIAISSSNASRITLPYPDWLEILLSVAAPDIDFVAVHNAYFPVLFEDRQPEIKDVYRALWAAPEAIDRNLSHIEEIIRKYEAGKDIGIAVTEWGPLYALKLDSGWFDQARTMGSAVYVGRVLQVFLSHPKVRIATYFKFTDGTPMGWVAFNGKPKVPYYALQLFSRHFGTKLVKSGVTGGKTYDTPALGIMSEEKNVPEVTAVAALNGKEDHLFVNLINRSWSEAHYVKLNINGFAGVKGETDGWLLASNSSTDHNGPDLSPELLKFIKEAPMGADPSGSTISLKKIRIDASKPIKLAPFSLLTVDIPKDN